LDRTAPSARSAPTEPSTIEANYRNAHSTLVRHSAKIADTLPIWNIGHNIPQNCKSKLLFYNKFLRITGKTQNYTFSLIVLKNYSSVIKMD
jgi:hypothetical protein